MAAIDDLIGKIADESLRQRIADEVGRLQRDKRFGLVFENHLPEVVLLPEVPVAAGATVRRRGEGEKRIYRVSRLEGGCALCRDVDTEAEETIPVGELVRVATLGEPVYPYLRRVDAVEGAADSPLWHALIEADNYHALQLLQYLHAGRVDCIYIDPPYNTGARDWKYNNDYVDSSDQYRHSKWLSMMERRLRLAKTLLNPRDSVLIVTIDEKEYLHLGCLLEQMFPEANITMATDIINPRAGVSRPGTFTRNQEYVFFIQIGESCVIPETQEEENNNPIWFSLMRTGSNSARQDRPNLFYPIWVYPNGKLHSVGRNIDIKEKKEDIQAPEDGLVAVYPLRPDGRENTWQLGRETLLQAFQEGTAKINVRNNNKFTINYLRSAEKERIKKGEIFIKGKDDNGALILERNPLTTKTKAPDAVWNKASHDAGIYGSSLLNIIFQDRRFPFPKSLYAVHDAIRFFVANKPEALILDFFAGSGTTLHAVNLLNAEDGGRRRCIMVTNNEVGDTEARALSEQGLRAGDEEWERRGIARYVTWPRTRCSITGQDIHGAPLRGNYIGREERPMREGFAANAIYFKLGFLDKDAVALGRQFRELLPLLWMKTGAVGACPELEGEEVPPLLVLPRNGFAVLTDERAFARFADEVNACGGSVRTAFLVTDSLTTYKEMASMLRVDSTCQLYRDYLDNFRINQQR